MDHTNTRRPPQGLSYNRAHLQQTSTMPQNRSTTSGERLPYSIKQMKVQSRPKKSKTVLTSADNAAAQADAVATSLWTEVSDAESDFGCFTILEGAMAALRPAFDRPTFNRDHVTFCSTAQKTSSGSSSIQQSFAPTATYASTIQSSSSCLMWETNESLLTQNAPIVHKPQESSKPVTHSSSNVVASRSKPSSIPAARESQVAAQKAANLSEQARQQRIKDRAEEKRLARVVIKEEFTEQIRQQCTTAADHGRRYLMANGTRSPGVNLSEQQNGFFNVPLASSRNARYAKQVDEVPNLDHRSLPSKIGKKLRKFDSYFEKLPQEIQDVIWNFAVNVPHVHVIRLRANKNSTVVREGMPYLVWGYEFRQTNSIPPLLQTCHAARLVALKHFTPALGTCSSPAKIRVNFELDHIFLDSCGMFEERFQPMVENMLEDEVSQIRHLTCRYSDYADAPIHEWSNLLRKMRSLKNIKLFINENEVSELLINRHNEEEVMYFLKCGKPRNIRDHMREDQVAFETRGATPAQIHNFIVEQLLQAVGAAEEEQKAEDWDDWVMVKLPWKCARIELDHFPGIRRGVSFFKTPGPTEENELILKREA